jgi:ABC-type multidrug transport system ATPase subunit
MTPPAIEARNLEKRFPPSCRALRDVSFSLPKGSLTVITGPNGSGKTTLLKILATLLIPDKGMLLLQGLEPGRADARIKQNIGFCPDQERSFYWRLTGRQNLDFFAALYGLRKQHRSRRIEDLLGMFKVDYADRRFDGYSSGMKKRFLLMRCLLHDPSLLLLDEPTKSLDADAAKNTLDVLENARKHTGATVVMSTHAPQEVRDRADAVLTLTNGILTPSLCSPA